MVMLFFSGCGKSVELTDEESAIISQYAASLLLEYDVNYESPLKEEIKVQEEIQEETVTEEKQEPVSEEEQQGMETETPEETVTEKTEKTKGSLTEVFGIDGIEVVYKECQFATSYPNNGNGSGGFMMTAERGQKLAILKFAVTNTSAQPQTCNILAGIPTFKATINGESAPARMTILLEDLSTTCEEIAPGATVEKILICQVSEGLSENVEQLEILTTFNKEISTVVLNP